LDSPTKAAACSSVSPRGESPGGKALQRAPEFKSKIIENDSSLLKNIDERNRHHKNKQ
jgi:hypothetical protein